MRAKINLVLIALILVTFASKAYPQSTYQNLGEKSRSAVDKTKKVVCDSLSPVNKAIQKTEKVAKEVWEKSEPIRKEATEKVTTYLKKTEPARKAALDSASKYLDGAIKKTKEAANEFKEGWDKGSKK
jgi:hypothetical protein